VLREARGYAEIKRMYVRPDQRVRRIGARVLAGLETIARGWGLTVLCLETGIHNREALAIYRRSGFRNRGPFGDYRDDP